MSVPAEISDGDEKAIIESLESKKYVATIARFIVHDGLPVITGPLGDTYRVPFVVEVEKRFVIRAPAGRYAFQAISQIVADIFRGERPGGCRIDAIVNFNIHEGTTTYVGRLSIVAQFKPGGGGKWLRALENLGQVSRALPEAALNMRVSATDMKVDSLREFAVDEPGLAVGVVTELMNVGERRENWNCMQAPPPAMFRDARP